MYKYSIIVPVYQVEAYLEKCIDCVLNQTYRNYELILVDNGATDTSGKICDIYQKKDERIKVIHLVQNVGISNARNYGLESALGEYILFLDADDFYYRKDFLYLVDERLSKTYADVLCFPYTKYFEKTDCFQKEKKEYDIVQLCDKPVEKGWKYLLENGMLDISAWSKVVKKSLLVENEILFQRDLIGEDLDWTLQLMEAAQSLDGIQKCCYAYRIRENSTVSKQRSAKACMDICNIINKWSEHYDIHKKDLRLIGDIKGYFAYQYYIVLAMFDSIEPDKKADVLEVIKNTKYITQYATGMKAKVSNIALHILGLNTTMKLLSFYLKYVWNNI